LKYKQLKMENKIVAFGTVLNDVIERFYLAKDHSDGVSGIATGFCQLDLLTGGWQNSDLIVIAGYPRMGKTALMLSMAINMAKVQNISVGIFSLHHSNEVLVRKMMCNEGESEEQLLAKGQLLDEEWARFNTSQDKLYQTSISFYDPPSPTFDELADKAYFLVQTEKIEVLLIDYLQLIRINRSKYECNYQDEIGAITRSLKILARELNIPIISLWQLSTPFHEESRFYGSISMYDDLPELTICRQYADVVSILHRPEYFRITENEHGQLTLGKAQLIITKNHFALTGNVKLNYNATCSKFLEDKE